MNVVAWKPAWWRRAQLLWAVPLMLLLCLICGVLAALVEFETGLSLLRRVWTGDRRRG